MGNFDSAAFRRHFPAICPEVVYLDSAATALKPAAVIEATDDFYRHHSGSVHRSQYRGATVLTTRYEQARQHVATWLNAPVASDIVWTRGTTESLNLVAQSYARNRLQAGDEILVSETEHHANLIPWLIVARQTGARVIKWPLGKNFLPDMSALPGLMNAHTRILALSQMSNVTGASPDIAAVAAIAHAFGAVVAVDGAQGAVHHQTDLQQLDIDFYAFSAHKLYGPTGIGMLYGKTALLAEMEPWQGGGKMLSSASFDGFVPSAVPQRFEAGTPNIAGVIGLDAALAWWRQQDCNGAIRYATALADKAERQLAQLPGFRSFRAKDSTLLSFEFDGVHHQDMAAILSQMGIALRAGQHCAQPLMAALGISGTLRASFAPYNTPEDVDRLIAAVKKALLLLTD